MNRLLILIAVFEFSVSNLIAQTPIPLTITPPSQVSVCEDNQFIAQFQIPSTSFPTQFEISMTPNLYDGNSSTLWPNECFPSNGTSTLPVIAEVDLTQSPNVQLNGNNWVISGYSLGDPISITYNIRINCSVYGDADLEQEWTLINLSAYQFNILNSIVPNIYETNDIKHVHFANPNINKTFYAAYLTNTELYFEYLNTSQIIANIDFQVSFPTNPLGCSGYIPGTFQYYVGTLTDPPNWSSQHYNPGDWITPNGGVPPGYRVFIKQLIYIDDCTFDCNAEQYMFIYRCTEFNDPSPPYCAECHPMNGQLSSAITEFGLFKIQETVKYEKIEPLSYQDYSCPNEFTNWKFKVTNEGTTGNVHGAIKEVRVRFKYNVNNPGSEYLTLIEKASVFVDLSNCSGCILTDKDGIPILNNDISNCLSTDCFTDWGPNYLCQNEISDPIHIFEFRVREMEYNESFDFGFQTYKCVENNPILFNKGMRFNHWHSFVSWYNECNYTQTSGGFATINVPGIYNGGNNGISHHSYSTGDDVNGLYTFSPSVTNLIVPSQPASPYFGPSADLFVDLERIVQHGPSAPTIFGDYELLGTSPFKNGVLLAEIYCDQGLRVEDINTDVFLTSYNDLSITINPNYAYQADPGTCIENNYYFYFDLATITPLQIDDILRYGRLNFRLQSCCPTVGATTPYEIKFYLLLRPNASCQQISQWPANGPPVCLPTPCAWLPVMSIPEEIAVMCPGCVTPGIIVDNYIMQRETFGYQDDNNNGILDDVTPPVSITLVDPWFVANQQNLRRDYSIHGDVIADRLVSHLQKGDCTNGGYEYNTMMLPNIKFNYLQLDRTIANADIMSLNPTKIEFFIDAPGSGSCIQCDEYGVDPGAWTTQRQLIITGPDIFDYLDQALLPNQWLFTFEDIVGGNIHSNITFDNNTFGNGSNGTGFFEDQQYRLYVQYEVCGNYDGTDAYLISQIDNLMWMSGSKHHPSNPGGFGPEAPESAGALHAAGWKFDDSIFPCIPCPNCSTLQIVNQGFADTYRFKCEATGGRHYFLRNRNEFTSTINTVSNCVREIHLTSTSLIGRGSTKDHFPLEFRPSRFEGQEWDFNFPSDYSLSSIIDHEPKRRSVQHKFNTNGSIGNDFNYVNFSPPLPTFMKTDLFFNPQTDFDCLNTATYPLNGNTLFSADQKNELRLKFFIAPDNCINPTSTINAGDFKVRFYETGLGCSTPGAASCSTTTIEITSPANDFQLILPEPVLVLNPPPPVTVNTNLVCFPIQILNNAGQGNTTAFNAFLAPLSSNNIINWYFVVGTTTYPSNQDGIIELGNLGSGANLIGTLCGTYNYCGSLNQPNPTNPWTFDLYYGWNCDGYPTEPNEACWLASEPITILDVNANVVPFNKFTPVNDFSLCEDFTIRACFQSNANGMVLPVSIDLNPEPGLIVQSVVIDDDCSNPAIVSTSDLIEDPPGSNSWIITPANLNDINLPPYLTINQNENCFCVTVTLTPGCDLELNYPDPTFLPIPDIYLVAQSYCGEDESVLANFPGNIPFDDESYCTDCYTITKTSDPPASFPGSNNLVTFYIEVCNNNIFNNASPDLTLTDIFPVDFIPDWNTSTLPTCSLPPCIFQVPPGNCVTFSISGYFDVLDPCHLNVAELSIDQNPDPTILTADACVLITDVCSLGSNIIIVDGYASDLINAGYTWPISNKSISVTGIFYIDDFAIFDNCTFYMEPGSQIIVLPFYHVDFLNSTLHACTDMWKGILLQDDSWVHANNTTIADAQYAIDARKNTGIYVHKVDFTRNFISLRIPPIGFSSIISNVTGYIRECTFTSGSGLKNQYPGQSPIPGSKSFAGIEIHTTAFNFMLPWNQPNIFEDLSNGFISYNSNVEIENCIFRNISAYSNYNNLATSLHPNGTFNGSAIYIRGGKSFDQLKQIGFGMTGIINFDICTYGIFAEKTSVYSENNNMQNVNRGYQVNFATNLNVDILNNTIKTGEIAIDLYMNDPARHLLVMDNELETSRIGIFINEQNNSNPYSWIHRNHILVRPSGQYGIFANAVSDYFITENRVTLSNNFYNRAGINLNRGVNTEVSCNNIIGDATNYNTGMVDQASIKIVQCDRPTVACNDVTGTENGLYFSMNSSGAVVRANNIYRHRYGLHIDNVGFVGTQHLEGNLWYFNPVAGGLGARNQNSNAIFFPFTYDPTIITGNPEPMGGWSPPQWFQQPITPGNNKTCSDGDPYCTTFNPCPGCMRSSDHDVAEGNVQNNPYTDETKWMLSKDLYYKLDDHPDLLNDSILNAFYDSVQNTLIAQFKLVSNEQFAIFELDSALQQNLIDNKAALEDLMDQLKQNTALLAEAIANNDPTAALLVTIAGIKQNIEALADYNETALTLAQTTSLLTAASVKAVNSTINTTALIEENLKTVNDIYFSTIAADNYVFDAGQLSTLEYIANQCPMLGGDAVFRARALYAAINDSIVYDDRLICLNSGVILRESANGKRASARLFPNPATDNVTLIYDIEEEATGVLVFFNSLGQLMAEYKVQGDNSKFEFSTSSFNPGVYHYIFHVKSERIDNGKLVIIR